MVKYKYKKKMSNFAIITSTNRVQIWVTYSDILHTTGHSFDARFFFFYMIKMRKRNKLAFSRNRFSKGTAMLRFLCLK